MGALVVERGPFTVFTATPCWCNMGGGCRATRHGRTEMVDDPLINEQAVHATVQRGVRTCHRLLWEAAWSASWATAEPKLCAARATLARELSWYYTVESTYEPTGILRTGAGEALQLVLRIIDTGIASEERGEDSTVECRRLVGQAITTLDEALALAGQR